MVLFSLQSSFSRAKPVLVSFFNDLKYKKYFVYVKIEMLANFFMFVFLKFLVGSQNFKYWADYALLH